MKKQKKKKLNKIFVLEDSPERREWFSSTFSDCEITFEMRIEPSLDLLREKKYDLIFLDRDLSLPHENGEDLTMIMHKEKLAKKSCIIIHTVNVGGQMRMRTHLSSYNDNVFVINFTNLIKMKREDFNIQF